MSEVNRSGDIGWGQRWARQQPCGSHLPITSVWFMSGPPQSQHSPRSTVPSALLTIINLHPTLPWHTYTQKRPAQRGSVYLQYMHVCCSAQHVCKPHQTLFMHERMCELVKKRHMYATHHLVGAWRLCLLAGLNCLIVLIVLREGQRETVSGVDRFLDATLKVKEQETSMKKRRSIFWLNWYETETLEADCTEPRGWISVEKHKHLNENRIWHSVDSNFSKHCRK